jgi:hypothetical protein
MPEGLSERSDTDYRGTAMALKNKVAIVTGGNSGIGQAIVLELAPRRRRSHHQHHIGA